MLKIPGEVTSTAAPRFRGMRSTLLPCAAVAVLLFAGSPNEASAAPIFCVSQSESACAGSYVAGTAPQGNTFKFYTDSSFTDLLYTLDIFGMATTNFTLDVRDVVTTQAALSSGGALANFPDAVCIPTHDAGSCGLFMVQQAVGSASWTDGYRLTITWFTNANPLSQPPDDGLNTILQAKNSTGGVFGNELREIDYDPAPTPTDPAIGGKEDAFSTFGAFRRVPTAVPEPASLMLFGTAVAGMLCRGRRRRSR